MKITEVCIRKPVLAWMMMAATIVFGAVAATRIGVSQFPDVDFPTITVSVTWEGAAPDVIENDVVEPIEEALMQVEGVESVLSTSRQGNASITVELNLKRNVDLALQASPDYTTFAPYLLGGRAASTVLSPMEDGSYALGWEVDTGFTLELDTGDDPVPIPASSASASGVPVGAWVVTAVFARNDIEVLRP